MESKRSTWLRGVEATGQWTRRRFVGMLGLGGAAAVVGARSVEAGLGFRAYGERELLNTAPVNGKFVLPPLPYAYDALEPYIDTETMQIHHDRHHNTYVTELNNALAAYPDLQKREVTDLLYNIETIPEAIRIAVRNNGGGHLNHSIFWATMGPGGGGQPIGALAEAINSAYGSFNNFKATLTDVAFRRFGSGWGWLVLGTDKKLQVVNRPNQDSPIMDGLAPLVGVDVWEHAYYLRYRNRRPDYLAAWWNTINWDAVGKRYDQSLNA